MKHLTPKEAHEFLRAHPEAVFIDVRCEMEYLFVGHPKDAISIPWREDPDWEINPDFLGRVRKAASTNRPLILICRSGHRSAEAGQFLESHGFDEVYNVVHGFEGELDAHHHRNSENGWRHDGLPWEQC